MVDAEPVLSVRRLVTHAGDGHTIGEVSFDVRRHSVLGIVGESGSGKTLIALSLMRLLPQTARISGGEVIFEGRNLLQLSEREMQQVRGRRMAMTFQEPATALSPVHTVGWQLGTALRASGRAPRVPFWVGRARALRTPAAELLRRVEMPDAERVLDAYPHQLSAGMRRRIALALALAANPALLIADEPTTGLDTPIQAQILDLFTRLTEREQQMSSIFITHDLSVAAEVATDIVVMYRGQIVESGPTRAVFDRPQHPYTVRLLESLPEGAGFRRTGVRERLSRPPLTSAGTSDENGCRFRERCWVHQRSPDDFPRCVRDEPTLEPAGAKHICRCFYPRLEEPPRA
jgi:peptide/nickel transport system ATP-binding protein